MLNRFHPTPERYGQTDGRTDRQTDGRTDRILISISHVSMLTRDKNSPPHGPVRARTPRRRSFNVRNAD